MLKVLLVDDEPFIIQGLKVLVDWAGEGCEVYEASDGAQALDFLKEHEVDLVIADIRMPVINGIELLKAMRTQLHRDAHFVILSGYAEFAYAQEALRYKCTDYILKPVEKDQLVSIVRKVKLMRADSVKENEEKRQQRKAYLDRTFLTLISGKYDSSNLEYIAKEVPYKGELSYVLLQLDPLAINEDFSDEEKKGMQRKLYQAVCDFLKKDADLCILNVSGSEKIYDIGLIFFAEIAARLQMTEKSYLNSLYDYVSVVTNIPVTILVGKHVRAISGLSRTYGTANRLRSLQGFREKKQIYYYEEEYQTEDNGILLCKTQLDDLIKAVELNEHTMIHKQVDIFFEEMQKTGNPGNSMNLNIHYLLFQLIHLASELDSEVNQEEVFRIISENTFEEGILRGGKAHLRRMACTYGDYLQQLQRHTSRGILARIEEEVRRNYAENLTLKELSEKYYVNSAYLGQLFRKQYGCSFKDFLNNRRMEEAALLLRKTDMKIYQVAEAVGYKDVDYFVNRFIEARGCTPAKYRKQ